MTTDSNFDLPGEPLRADSAAGIVRMEERLNQLRARKTTALGHFGDNSKVVTGEALDEINRQIAATEQRLTEYQAQQKRLG